MRKLIALLAATTAIFAGTTLYLYLHGSDAVRPAHDDVHPTPGVVSTTSRTATTPAPPAAPATPSAAGAPAPRSRPNEFERAFLDRDSDPARRAQLVEETKVGVRRENPSLDRVLELNAGMYDLLMSLLAEQKIQARKTSIECKYASTCGTRIKQLRESQQADLTALLGPDGKQRFDQYLESRAERLSVNSMRGRLSEKSRLADSQVEALTAALADERQRVTYEKSGVTPVITFDGVPLVYGAEATLESLMDQAQAYQARLRARAATLLTPEQLAVYDQLIAEKMIMVRAMIQSAVDDQAKVVH
jgi:hypothetical protein